MHDDHARRAVGCPLSAEDLSSASGLSFELRDTREDYPLETVEAKGRVCVYTSSDRPQAAGDPLVLRVDTVTGAGAAVLQSGFAATCVQAGGPSRTRTSRVRRSAATAVR